MPHVNAVVQNYLRNVVYPTDSSTNLTTNISRLLKDATHSGTPNQKFQRLFRNGYQTQILTEPGLVAFWRLADAVGATTAKDASLNSASNVATVNAGVTMGQTAAPISDGATAALFDGTSGTIQLTDNATLHVGDTFTLELWIKRSAVSLGATAILFNGNTGAPAMLITTTNVIQCSKSAGANVIQSTVAVTDTTTWHHLVWTKNGATGSVLWLDGVDITANYVDQTIVNTNTTVFIGSNPGALFYPGSMANVAFYSTSLSAATVAAHYALRP